MTNQEKAIQVISAAVDKYGAAAVARAAGVSPRTVSDHRARGYMAKTIADFVALEKAAAKMK